MDREYYESFEWFWDKATGEIYYKGEKMKEKRCSYRVVICINDLPNQSVEDMELNAQGYIPVSYTHLTLPTSDLV